MPWQVPITVDGLEYPVTFNTEGEPSQQDYDDAVQQILSQKAQATPAPEQETPGYLSQLGSALGLGYRQMKSGVGATFNALTGDMPDVAAEMAEMSKLQREQQALQTPEDVAFMRGLDEAEKSFDKASGPLETIGALAEYPAAVLAQPGAAFKTAIQSAPNALISGATSLAGYGLGGLLGGAATLETGPGAILGGLAGAAAGGALSNTLMEAGPSIFDVLNERTQGAASNMTADEIAAYLQQNPDIVDEGLKTGAIRGSVIGAVEALGVKGAGRLLTMPERAAARAVQKELVAAGVDVASKEAVDQALLDPALNAATKAAAEAAKSQFSSAGNIARLAGAAAIDTGSAGVGEIAAQAAAGQDISTKEAFMEMLGDAALSLPMSVATKAVEGAQYMLNPSLVTEAGEASAANLAATGNAESAIAQDGFNQVAAKVLSPTEPAVQPVKTAEAVEAPDMSGLSDLGETEGDLVGDFGLELRGIQQEARQPAETLFELPPPQKRNLGQLRDAVIRQMDETQALVEGGDVSSLTPEYDRLLNKYRRLETLLGKIEAKMLPPSLPEPEVTPYEPTTNTRPEILPENLPNLERDPFAEEETFAEKVTPLSEGAERNRALIAEAYAKFRGEAPKDLSAGLQAAIPQQTPQENALQVDQAGEVLQREQGETGETGSERQRMEQGQQGQEAPIEGQVQEKVITPQGTPTLATEGTPTSRDVGTERDSTKPEQMTLDEATERVWPRNKNTQNAPKSGEANLNGMPAIKKAGGWMFTHPTLGGMPVLSPSEVNRLDHQLIIQKALTQRKPVAVEPVDWYDITLPEGYVRQGDLYIFQPEAPASPLRISIPEGATSSRTDNVKYQVAGLPDEVVDPFLAHGTDSADAVEALVKSGPRKDTEHYEGRLVPKDDGSPWGNTKTSASFVIISKPGQTTSSPNEIGAVVVNRTSRGDEKTASMIAGMERRLDGTGVAVLTPEELPNWLRRTVSQPTAAEKQVKQTSSKKAKSVKMDESKAIAEYPDLETFFEREIFPSGKKGGWILKEKRTGARLSSGKTKEEASAEFRKSLLWQQAWNEEYPSVFEMVNKLIEDKSINAEKYSQSYKVKPSKEEWLSILEGRLAELRQDREDTIKKNRSVGARPNTEFVDNFIANVEARLAKLQTTAAETQTPVPLREGTGAAGVTERQPSGGSIPEVAPSETQETQPSTKENDAISRIDRLVSSGAKPEEMDKFVKSLSDAEFNALVESEAFEVKPNLAIKPKDTYDAKRIKRRKFVDQINATAAQARKTAEQIFKEEEAALERQRKMDERTQASLNSIIDPEKTNIVQGTVSAADAESARRALNNSGEIPNAFLTRIYASPEAFLADRANQRYFPSSYARLQSEGNIEGLFERGQTLIFADKIGVSDLDRRIGKNLGISPEQAAARRVIAHENGHRSVALFTANEKREFLGYLRRKYNDAQIDNLVRVYSEYADWRTNLESRNEALEELFLKDFERLEKIPTGGLWDDIVDFLKRVWRRLTGRKGDPTLQDMKDVVRLLRNAMRRTAVPSFTTKDGGEVKLSYAGEKAIENLPEERRQFMRDSLDTAKAMAAAGKDSEDIRAVTGWFPGKYDGKMRWEVPDNGASLISTSDGSLESVLKHEELFSSYPSLSSVKVIFEPIKDFGGLWNRDSNTISILNSMSDGDKLNVLLHEVQHAIQDFEGFARGSNPSQFSDYTTQAQKRFDRFRDILDSLGDAVILKYNLRNGSANLGDAKEQFRKEFGREPHPEAGQHAKFLTDEEIGREAELAQERLEQAAGTIRRGGPSVQYRKTAGEIEARDVQARQKLTPEQRAATAPYSSENIAPEDAIVMFGGGTSMSASKPEYASDYSAAVSAGAQLARDTVYDDRIIEMRDAIRRAYEQSNTEAGVAMPLDELYAKAKELAPDMTENEFGNILQDLYEDNGAVLQEGDIKPTLTEEDRRYLALAQNEDANREELQRMVDEAAKAAGYNVGPVYHGTKGKKKGVFPFTVFDTKRQGINTLETQHPPGSYFAENIRYAEGAAFSQTNMGRSGKPVVGRFFLRSDVSQTPGVESVVEYLATDPSQIKSADPVTRDDAGNVIPPSRRFDTGPDIRGQIDVFTPEGRRAGFAVIMPKRAVASRVETEGPSVDEYKKKIEAINSNSLNAFFGGVQMKGASPQVRTVKPSKSYEQAAIELVNDLTKDGTPIEDIAESLFSEEFLQGLGIKLDIPALVSLIAEVKNRVSNQSRDDKIPGARRIKLQKLDRKLAGYWQDLGTNSGRSQGIRSYITRNPRYRWMFIFDKAEEQLRKDRELAATRVASDLPQTADNLQRTDAKAGEQVADDLEDNQDAIDLAEGEATLDQKGKTLWEKFKDLIRKRGIAMRALNALRAGNKAKASISSEERNTISQMSEEELVKFIAGIDKEMAGVFDEFTKAPATRKKREKMVATAKKRAEQGKPIEVTSVNTADVIDGIFVGFNDRDSIINEVGDALLKAAEQRKVKPKQKTAIQDLIAAIRQTLTANLKGEQIKADQPSLGKLLGKTFAQQGSEAALFAKSWEDGRKKVRAMLAEIGIDEASLDEELDTIMPPTPTLAYAPAAAKKAINVAIKEAGLTPQDALSNPVFFRESIMAKFNEAAEKDNLTEEGWNQSGKALAEKAVNEFIDNARIKAEKRSAESKAKMEKRKVEIADKRASQLIYSVEERFRQGSKDLQTSKSGDSINKAFRDQVKNPVSKFEFFQRLAKLNVSQNVSERLFKTAAREKADLQAMEVFRRLEGPNALQTMLREIQNMRRGEEIPLRSPIPWRKLLSQKASTVEVYRQRIFDAISSEESLADLDDAQKAKLADLFTQAWESKRKAILDRMVDNAINQEEAAGRLTQEGADALRSQRQKLVEDINLGILDEDRLMKHLADKFGIKSEFTEAERANIDRLLDILQDDKLNEVKRNKAAYELLEALSSATKIPIAKLLADYWVSSVLSGVNTAASIAMAVMSGGYELTTGAFRILRAGFTNPKELPAEIAASFKAMAEFLKAFGREGRLAWQYLVTGDRAFLDPSMNTVLNDLNYDSIGKTVSLAEKMAKSDKIMQRVMGIWMRSVSRLLTALDSFNSGVTKAGALPIVFRQLNLDAESLKQAAEKYNLQLYRDRVIQRDFNGNKPTTAHDKALVDSYAKAEMMADLQEFGKFSENADFFGQQGAMTLDPTGVGGFIYSSIKSLTGGATNRADKFLAEAEREWKQAEGGNKTAKGLQLAFAYFLQFGAYNSANLAGLRFARFAGNKFNQGLSFIPGIGMFRMYEATVKDSKIEAKDAFTDMILRNQTAGVLFAIIGAMALKAITDEPDDEKRGFFWNGGWANLTPDRKQQKLAAGQKEYTIGIPGGISFNYQNWPISPIMAAIGSLSDLARFSPEQWNEKSVIGRLGSAAASGVFSAGEIPALSGFQTLFGNNLSSKDPNEKRLDRFAKVMAGWGGGFVPRILKDIDFMTDPGLRKYESLWEQTASHIPVYRRYSGEEYYDILGKQIERKVWPGSREFMELETDPEYRTLGKLNSRGIWLTPANAEHRMVGKGRNKRKLTQEEADAYSLETGKGYRQMLLRYGSRLEQMPTERARAFLMDKADEVRDRALKKIVR